MKIIRNLSIVNRVLLCISLSLMVNVVFNFFLKRELTERHYTVLIEAVYSHDGSMQLDYDAGANFSEKHKISNELKKGNNLVEFSFELNEEEQLRYLRLDFGSNRNLEKVELNSLELFSKNRLVFRLDKTQIINEIGFANGVSSIDKNTGVIRLNRQSVPLDPYINFNSNNELIYPKWLRVFLLILPWLVVFFAPVVKWFLKVVKQRDYAFLFISLFIVSISLKIAWVTFTSLLLLLYALVVFFKRRKIRIDIKLIAITTLFVVALLFVREGNFSDLNKSFGFVLFPVIFSIIDCGEKIEAIKETYTNVFLVLMSITIVSWLVLILYSGYYYNIDVWNYFRGTKLYAHRTMYWLYYHHPTFLCFFIILGVLFCRDMYYKKKVSFNYVLLYNILSFCVILILGSKFALFLFMLMLLVQRIPRKRLSILIAPMSIILVSLLCYTANYMDMTRGQLWATSWVAFKERLWLGYGEGSSDVILHNLKFIKEAGFDYVLNLKHSHNQYLTYLLETGVIGTVIVFTAVIYIVRAFVFNKNEVMMLFSVMLLLLMCVESPFETATPLYTISFILSLFSSSFEMPKSNL